MEGALDTEGKVENDGSDVALVSSSSSSSSSSSASGGRLGESDTDGANDELGDVESSISGTNVGSLEKVDGSNVILVALLLDDEGDSDTDGSAEKKKLGISDDNVGSNVGDSVGFLVVGRNVG